jgi:hypothetical protein
MTLLQELDKSADKKTFLTALKKWKAVTKGEIIYRGINENTITNPTRAEPIEIDWIENEIAYEIEVRKDRQPLHSSGPLHNKLNKWLQNETGIKFRSESVFVTKSEKLASQYGKPYVFVPKGEFSYCWSPYISDAYVLFNERRVDEELLDYLSSDKMRSIVKPILAKHKIESVEEFDNQIIKMTQTKLFDILSEIPNLWRVDRQITRCPDDTEIMVACDSYYLLSFYDYQNLGG